MAVAHKQPQLSPAVSVTSPVVVFPQRIALDHKPILVEIILIFYGNAKTKKKW